MKRVPKFTAGMFKPKMKRFGGPKIKKFAEGGDTDDLVPRGMLPDENAAELAARARGSKGPSKRFRNKPSPPVIEEEVVVDPKEFYKEKMRERQMEQDRAKKEREEFDRMYDVVAKRESKPLVRAGLSRRRSMLVAVALRPVVRLAGSLYETQDAAIC
jgi:hypothetical protein